MLVQLAFVATAPFLGVSAAGTSALPASQPVVKLKDGSVSGTRVGSVAVFKGLPFAKAPVGELRFSPPQPPEPWAGTLNATNFRHNCMQTFDMGWPQPLSTLSEDCLYVNVYAPASPPPKLSPVMLWLYGGGFQGGGGNETRLNGTWNVELMEQQRIHSHAAESLVIVTCNYRVGVFGFIAADELRLRDPDNSTGNAGIQDQRMCMQWVHDNIQAFSGDPKRVFIVGQSAGGASVANHLVRPKSWGLFARAGIESGAFPVELSGTVADKADDYKRLVEALGCASSTSEGRIKCLLSVPAEKLLHTSVQTASSVVLWSPAVDGVDLVDFGTNLAAAGKIAPGVQLLVGSVAEDGVGTGPSIGSVCQPDLCTEEDFRSWGANGWHFSPGEVENLTALYADDVPRPGGNASKWYWAAIHAAADEWGTCPSQRLAHWAAAAGNEVFYYYWRYAPKGPSGECSGHPHATVSGTPAGGSGDGSPRCARHACEQPFVFHVLSETAEEASEDQGKYHIDPSERAFSQTIVELWASMAAAGKPASAGLGASIEWVRFDAHTAAGLAIGSADTGRNATAFTLAPQLRAEKCAFWGTHGPNRPHAALDAR